jgi:hypothetical protein
MLHEFTVRAKKPVGGGAMMCEPPASAVETSIRRFDRAGARR